MSDDTHMKILLRKDNVWYLDDAQIYIGVSVDSGLHMSGSELGKFIDLPESYFYVHKLSQITSIDFYLIIILESIHKINDLPLNRLELVALSNYFDVIVDSYKNERNQVIDQVVRKIKPIINDNVAKIDKNSSIILTPLIGLVSDLCDLKNIKLKKEVFNLRDELDDLMRVVDEHKISWSIDSDIDYIYCDPVKLINLLKILIEELSSYSGSNDTNIVIQQHENDKDYLNFVISCDTHVENAKQLETVANILKNVNINVKIANSIVNSLGGELIVRCDTGINIFFTVAATKEDLPDSIAKGSLKYLRNKKVGFICNDNEYKNEFFKICNKWGLIGVVSGLENFSPEMCDVVLCFSEIIGSKYLVLEKNLGNLEHNILKKLSGLFFNEKQHNMPILIVCPNINECMKIESVFKNAGCSNITTANKIVHANLYKMIVFDLDYVTPAKVVCKSLLVGSKSVKGFADMILKPLKAEVISIMLGQMI